MRKQHLLPFNYEISTLVNKAHQDYGYYFVDPLGKILPVFQVPPTVKQAAIPVAQELFPDFDVENLR